MDGETTQMSVNEAIAVLMERLPLPVQNFLKSERKNQVIYEISQKYRLHTDQAGDFERAALFMLLGIYSPEEFLANLKTAGIPEQVAQGLTREVNEKIFIPLREEERALTDAEATLEPDEVPAPTLTTQNVAVPVQSVEVTAPITPIQEQAPAWNPQPYPTAPQFQQPFYGGQAQTYWIPVSISPIQHPMNPFPQYGAPYTAAPQMPAQEMQVPPPTIPVMQPEAVSYTEPTKPQPLEPMQDTPPRPEPPLTPPSPSPIKREYTNDPYREVPL
jgi:hypothetical protein